MTKIVNNINDEIKPEINLKSVEVFFANRARKVNELGYKSTVMYQDKNLQLAEERDFHEKKNLLPKLSLSFDDRCLDIGCGTGRWADVIVPYVNYYHGVDLSDELLDIARDRFAHYENIQFTCLKGEELTFQHLKSRQKFSKILCFGVLMYLNDKDIENIMNGIVDCADEECLFLLREPVALEKRLTIVEHYSDDMDQYYNAIYRTKEELLNLCNSVLNKYGFRLQSQGDVFSEESLNNRKETKQLWFLLQKGH